MGEALTKEGLDAEIECLFSESDSSSVHMEKVRHAQAIEASHEALRAEVSRLEAERDAFRLHHVEACHDLHIRAALAALGDPAAEVRAVLREVLDAELTPTYAHANIREALPPDLRKLTEEVAR